MTSFSTGRGRLIAAIVIPCLLGWLLTYFGVEIFRDYSFGLFIWLPVMLGALSTIIFAYKNDVLKVSCRNIAYIALLIYCIGLLTFAFEGIICLIMAAPIGFLFTWVGYLIGYTIVRSKIVNAPLVALILVFSVPAVMSFDYINGNKKETLRHVTTSVIINAAPEVVWKTVVAFPKLKEPTELLFKAGIAYPISANINGSGVGAIRHCNFSTGSFVEPITVWDEPHLLQFNVSDQPETMRELSFYNLHPNHLHGYFVSDHGQFKLTKLPNGNTLLEGTTWYYNKIKPGVYWNLWSDYIIHKIHRRVLDHIKTVCEKAD